MNKREDRLYVLYDGRACGGVGTEDAAVLVACESSEQARGHQGDFGAMACYSYRKIPPRNGSKEGYIVDERWEWDYYPEEDD